VGTALDGMMGLAYISDRGANRRGPMAKPKRKKETPDVDAN